MKHGLNSYLKKRQHEVMLSFICLLSAVALLFASDLSSWPSRANSGTQSRDIQAMPAHSGRQHSAPAEPLTRAILVEAVAAKIKAIQSLDTGSAILPVGAQSIFSLYNAAQAVQHNAAIADDGRFYAAARAPPSAA